MGNAESGECCARVCVLSRNRDSDSDDDDDEGGLCGSSLAQVMSARGRGDGEKGVETINQGEKFRLRAFAFVVVARGNLSTPNSQSPP